MTQEDMIRAVKTALTFGKVWDWCEAQPPKSVVGFTCIAGDCPLARCLRDLTGLEIHVGTVTILADNREVAKTRDFSWLPMVLEDIDVDDQHEGSPVTRESMLRLLATAMARHQEQLYYDNLPRPAWPIN